MPPVAAAGYASGVIAQHATVTRICQVRCMTVHPHKPREYLFWISLAGGVVALLLTLGIAATAFIP